MQVFNQAGLLVSYASLESSYSFMFIQLLVSKVTIDHMFPQGHEVQPGTHKLSVSCLTVGTLEDFELIQLMLGLIPQLAVHLEV